MFIEIGGVLVSTELFTEQFCCDLAACKGQCCIEGEAGAPVAIDEVAALEEAAEVLSDDLSAAAQSVIRRQGVVYNDAAGDLVTSIVDGRDCVFACTAPMAADDATGTACCLCTIERAHRAGRVAVEKPISCALYPLRERRLRNGTIALHYDRWTLCAPARERGQRDGIPLYRFLRAALLRRFGAAWYAEVEEVAAHKKEWLP